MQRRPIGKEIALPRVYDLQLGESHDMSKYFLTMVNGTLLCTGFALAQSTSNSPASSQSWVGLLVAAGCASSGTSADMRSATPGTSNVTENGMAKSSPGSTRERNTTYEQTQNQADGGSTGSADRADTRKSSEATSATSDLKNSTPEATNNNSSNMALKNEDAWIAAEKIAGNMDKTCHISSQTTSFAIRLPDGRMIPFYETSNSKIASQIQSTNRLGGKTKIFRVIVTGSMQGDRIRLESLKL
jgi:hypothetical protein